MSATMREQCYRLDPNGVGDWHIVAEQSGGYVKVASASLGASLTLPRAWLLEVVHAPAPVARHSDPAAAHDAAIVAQINAAENRLAVLYAHADAGYDGLTGDELELATGKEYQTVGPRRPWLVEHGYVANKGTRRNNRKGNAEGVYVITPAGRLLARRLRAEGVAA